MKLIQDSRELLSFSQLIYKKRLDQISNLSGWCRKVEQ